LEDHQLAIASLRISKNATRIQPRDCVRSHCTLKGVTLLC
jgi:hypothetical protein